MSRSALATVTVAAAITALAGCANDAEDKPTRTSAAAAKAAPKTAPELIGTWKARVPLAEIPDLQEGASTLGPDWEIEILRDGGIEGGPTLVYTNRAGDVSGGYSYKVAGDRITITDLNCSSGPAKNVYSFAVASNRLTFKSVKNNCADRVLDDLLTARPWRRS
jgi:hypothetical protein